MTAWNFADFSSEFRGDAMPHINQKGLVTYNREPKNIYYWYKTILNPNKKTSRFFRGLPSHISNSPKKEILIISNQDVKLAFNQKKPIVLKPSNGLIKHAIALNKGDANLLQVFDTSDNFQDSISIPYYSSDLLKTNSLAINFGTDSYFIDSNEQIWVPISHIDVISLTGDVKIQKSSTNIRNTFDDPIYQSSITNVRKIEIDAPKGNYKLTLVFSKLEKDQKQIYDLNKKGNSMSEVVIQNSLIINNQSINLKTLNPYSKEEVTIDIFTDSGIIIEAKDKTAFNICGILIKKN